MPEALITTFFAFVATLLFIKVTDPIARRTGLVDTPDKRKTHDGVTPLTGGIAIFLALILALAIWAEADGYLLSFVSASGILVLFGAIDDRTQLKVRYRIIVELAAASIMIFGANLWVGNLGNLLGFGYIHMPFWIAYVFTIIAVFGIINAVNMIDGLDGLAGGVSLAIFIVLLIYNNESHGLATFGYPLAGALAAFLISNSGVFRRIPKVFLGDAGSKLLGLAIVWVLIEIARLSDGSTDTIQPSSALYLVAIPLMDMVDTTIARIARRASPFAADRRHLHHVLLDLGLSPATVVFLIVAVSLAFNILGVTMSVHDVPESSQFAFFVGGFLALVWFKSYCRVSAVSEYGK